MSEFNILLINYEIIKLYYTHEGIFGKGIDRLLEQPCTLHLMKAKSLKQQQEQQETEGDKFIMQVYSSLQTDIFYRKLDQLAKSFYQFSTPHQLPIHHISYKKNEETKLYDLYVMYEFSQIDNEGKSLAEIMLDSQQVGFSEEQLWELVQVLVDQIYMGGRLSYEYLDINPWNIYYRGSKPVVANFGLQQHAKFMKKLFCPSDRFFQKNILPGGNQQSERLIEMYMRSYIFAIGMLILYIGGKEDPNQVFTENGNSIRPDLLQKKIDQFKKQFSEPLGNFISRCLQIKEEKRLDIEEVIQEKGAGLINREIYYYQGKLEGSEFYSGFMDTQKQRNGVGEFLMENKEIYKGMFQQNQREGYGIWFDNTVNFASGYWQQDDIKKGTAILKNEYLYFGELVNNKPGGNGIIITLSVNQEAKFIVFEGTVGEEWKAGEGRTMLRDGSVVDEVPEMGEKEVEVKAKVLNE